jgi:gamma-aminobutyric acid type B receptor
MMGPWFLFVGFCVTYAAIFSKLRRINQIESSSLQMKRVTITPIQVLRVFAILLTLNLSILIAWTVVAPWTYLEIPTASLDGYGRVGYFLAKCEAENSGEASYFYIALGVLNVLAIMVCWYESYKARNTKVAYNENTHVIMALVISSQSFLVGAPLVIAADNPSARYFCSILAVTWGCLGILCPIMVPKVQQVRRWTAEQAAKEANRRARIERADAYFANVAAAAEAPTIPTESTLVSTSTETQQPPQTIALGNDTARFA